MPHRVEVIGVSGMPEVRAGDDLAGLTLDACRRGGLTIEDGDVVVVTSKVVSKAEGRLVHLEGVAPSSLARRLAEPHGKDPRGVEIVLGEAVRVVRAERGVLITETEHGFVCANSGVDGSNLEGSELVALLPEAPDRSAASLRARLEEATSHRLAVIISDTFGRPWREGAVNVAIGVSGLDPLKDYRGEIDTAGRTLETTTVAIADEIAGAAELVMGKLDRVPVALVRGYDYTPADTGISRLIRKREYDLFR